MNNALMAALISGLLFSCHQTVMEPMYRYQKDIELLVGIVRAEAGNQSLEGKRAVVDVVLNRVDNEDFPSSIEKVIFQPGQFSCMQDGHYEKYLPLVDETDYEAVRLELLNRTDYEILYFSSGECYNGEFAYKIGDHYFAR